MTYSSRSSPEYPTTTLKRVVNGPVVFGAALIFFAIVTVVSQKFWPPVPDSLPFRSVWLNVSAAMMGLTGAGLFFASTRTLSAALVTGLYVLFVLCFLPRVISYAHLIGAWLGFAEHLAILAGALSIWLQSLAGGAAAHIYRVLRIMFGLCAIVFGLSHVMSLTETIALVPAWLPGSKDFWAVATAVAHFAVAVALILNWQVRAASMLGAGLYLALGVLVWLPIILKAPGEWVPWACIALSLALAGALFSVGTGADARPAASWPGMSH